MNKLEQIADFIENSLDSVYCDSCNAREKEEHEYKCDECHRKSMNWGISRAKAESITVGVISIMREEEEPCDTE